MNSLNDFAETYNAHAAAVYRVCLRVVGRPEVAEDITSEVFLLFHQDRHKVPPEQLPGWLFTVAKRRAADFWRRFYMERRWSEVQVDKEPYAEDPEFTLEFLLNRCTALKQIHKVCFILRFRHGMSRTEIAAQTGLSEFQVKGHLQYGLQLLRTYLESRTPHGTSTAVKPYVEGRNMTANGSQRKAEVSDV